MASPRASAPTPHREVQGVRVPWLIYGTAWKEGRTASLTRQALDAGFRAIDTANQRRHYHEAAVGEALASLFKGGTLRRENLFLQTKFTFLEGQDRPLPYDAEAPVPRQVEQSFESSLAHLGVDRLDAFVLHGPSLPEGLGRADWQAWEAMESLQRAGRTLLIGVSNVTVSQLSALFGRAAVKPAVVQNRCFARPHADREVRAFCHAHEIAYQGFSLLTSRKSPVNHPEVRAIAGRMGKTPAQVVFRLAIEAGITVLTGTTSHAHMIEDLEAPSLDPAASDLRAGLRLMD